MRILYFSTLCSEKEFIHLFNNSKVGLSQQMQKYNLVLTQGFARLDDVSIIALSARPITRAISKKIVFRKTEETEKGVKYVYLPFLNFKVIKSLLIFFNAIIIGINLRIDNKKKSIIVCDVLNIPLLIASKIVGKVLGVPVVGIVTDVPGYYSIDEGNISFKRKIFNEFHQHLIRRSDYYVFLTSYMNDVINKKDKPYCIIEGQVDSDMVNVNNMLQNKNQKIVIMYAGSVNKANGIDILVAAFVKANIDNAELHIYGNGSYSDELIQIEQETKNIKYFRSVPNNVIVEKEIEADLLINPRPTDKIFVKYSFPSKNMEYMVSGTPVLTTKLPGMPVEYLNYVYIIENETVDGICEKLKDILSKSKEELYKKGLSAKNFVLEHKNNRIQAKKIIDMVKSK